jgi:hypothetical protein
MKKKLLLGIFAAVLVTQPTTATTTFTNADTANSLIQNAGNWSNGLPSSTNLGTININASYTTGSSGTMTGYFMTQTGGNMSMSGGATFNLNSGSYTLDGASAVFNYSGLGLGANTVFTVNAGTGTAPSAADTTALLMRATS